MKEKNQCNEKEKNVGNCYGGNCSNEQFNHCYPNLKTDTKPIRLMPNRTKHVEDTEKPMKETTKIVAIPCRDCKRVLTILTGHSANIIEARCPDCKEAFDKQNIAYNKEIGYNPEPEPLTDGEIWGLANKCVFGLEYVILKTDYDKTTPMIEDGMKFCDFIINESGEKTTTLVKTQAKTIKTELSSLLADYEKVSETRIREIQHFMNEASNPYLQSNIKRMRPRNRRGGCFG